MCNVKNGPCVGKFGCMLEMVCSERAAQLIAERLRNNNQQPQHKICADILESKDVCDYCANQSKGTECCDDCFSHDRFIGRKLRAVR